MQPTVVAIGAPVADIVRRQLHGREVDAAVVRVVDAGAGLSEDMIPHIFDLFMQADRITMRLPLLSAAPAGPD